MTSLLVASAAYRFGRVIGDTATVPAELARGVSGQRDGYDFMVSAPDTTSGERFQREAVDGEPPVIWCLLLSVECRKVAIRTELNPDEALLLTAAIARDVLTALVLNLPKLGFPGETPRRESSSVTINGEPAQVGFSEHLDKNSVMIISERVLTLEEIQRAATGQNAPSRALMMTGEAGFQALFNPEASEVTAVKWPPRPARLPCMPAFAAWQPVI